MYITKKELLEKTGISYGQLYRWKREGLIPEEWFIKKSSKTGQETYLPQEQISERIAFIKKYKDDHSIEEIAQMLDIHNVTKTFTLAELYSVKEIRSDILKILKEGTFSLIEAAFLAIVSDLSRSYPVSNAEINEIIASCAENFDTLPDMRMDFAAAVTGNHVYGIILPEGTQLIIDKRIHIIKRYSVDTMAAELAVKYLTKI